MKHTAKVMNPVFGRPFNQTGTELSWTVKTHRGY